MDRHLDQLLMQLRRGTIDRRQFLARAAALGVSLAAAESLVARPSRADAAGPQRGGTFTFFTSADPKTLDPALIASWDQDVVIGNIYEGLLRLSPAGNSIEPGIAQSVQVTPDGKTWTFTLRKAYFHNGRQVTADDFKYTFERVLNPATQSPKAWMLSSVVGADAFVKGKAPHVSGIKVLNPSMLQIELTQAMAPFKSMMATVNLGVVAREAVQKYGADFGQNVVSAGPFSLSQWNANQNLSVKAFDQYWAGRPYLDTVQWDFIADENTRIVQFQAHKLDDAWVTPAAWSTYDRGSWRSHLNWAHTLHTEFWIANMQKAPFGTNPALRKALAFAINMPDVILELQGRATIATGLLAPGLAGFQQTTTPTYTHNVAKAKQLLKEAGYPNGLPDPVEVILPPWSNEIQIHQIYQSNLAAIGIQLKLKPTEYGAYLQQLGSGNFSLAWGYRVADYVDPDSFYYPLLASSNIGLGGNWARYRNSRVDSLLAQARSAVADSTRIPLYTQVHKQVMSDLPYVPLFHNIWVDVSQPRVHNYVASAMDTHMFHRVWVSS